MTFNLDVVESDGTPFPFTHGGEEYVLPARPDIVAASLLSTDIALGLERLLGPEQWKRLVASPAVLDRVKARALLAAYQDHLGTSSGESSASTSS